MKPMIITQNRVKTSVNQSIRETASETIRTTAAKMTYADLQDHALSELEESILWLLRSYIQQRPA